VKTHAVKGHEFGLKMVAWVAIVALISLAIVRIAPQRFPKPDAELRRLQPLHGAENGHFLKPPAGVNNAFNCPAPPLERNCLILRWNHRVTTATGARLRQLPVDGTLKVERSERRKP